MNNQNFNLSKSRILFEEKILICSVCLDEIPFSKSLELCCKHRFCLECLSREWEYNIMNGYFSPERLKCPNETCKVPISYYELKNILKPEVFKKYEENSIKNFQTQKGNPEIVVICPNKTCQIKYMVNRNLSYFQCTKCNLKYCLDCLGEWSKHEGFKCHEFKNKYISEEERQFRDEIKMKKWMECPECKLVVEKIEFCNFIKCTSPLCETKTCFCYLCGKKLTQKEHYDHFIDKNPYANSCLGKTGKNNLKDHKENTNGRCPKCGTIENEVCEFQSNFNNKICFCKSETCKNQYICLRCREYLNDKLFNKHLDQADFDCTQSKSNCNIF